MLLSLATRAFVVAAAQAHFPRFPGLFYRQTRRIVSLSSKRMVDPENDVEKCFASDYRTNFSGQWRETICSKSTANFAFFAPQCLCSHPVLMPHILALDEVSEELFPVACSEFSLCTFVFVMFFF